MAPRVPVATYRVQLTKDFGFAAAAALVPYLKDLGISHLYASPFLAARPGSTHGYDIVDHARLSADLGGDAAFEAMSNALNTAGMGLILDFVPNHMGVGYSDNAWWLDVLEWGQKSPHAPSFDIDWQGLPYREQPGVLLPILGKPYGDALQRGEIRLTFDAATGSFAAWYFEHKLPINPQRYGEILRTIVAHANAEHSDAGRQLTALAEQYRERGAPSYADAPRLKQALATISGAADIIATGLIAYRGDSETGWPTLHRLLERQAYHLAYWRVAFSAINYRRFFDINDLAGLRAEHPATFRAMHVLVARLIAEGRLQGIRLDHIDGLWDPAQYTRRLSELIRRVRPGVRRHDFYVLVEKILGPHEPMPQFPAVDGTTGYERLNLISRVLLDSAGLGSLDTIWRDFTGERASFPDMLRAAKQRVLATMLASEFTVLARALARIAAGHFSSRDYTLDRLRAALEAYVIEFPVYRTYITASRISEADRETIADVVERARARWDGPDPDIFGFLRDAITADLAHDSGYSAPRVRSFALKLQQFTGPLMAKSLEDTAFYRYHRLLALNEVGGEPAAPELSVDDFHREQARLAKEMPHGLVATATHDTKRGEDARMRILTLAEMPENWRETVTHWRSLNAPHLKRDAAGRSPSAGHEYMVYQSLVGAWPFEGTDETFTGRMQAYALKAAREGKRETSWTNPRDDYEAGLHDFVAAILDPQRSGRFVDSIAAFAQRTALLGALNSLSQVALKLTLPGVPDFFQGTELWDFSLVDPDNRRAVDFPSRGDLLKQQTPWAELAANWRDGRIKLALTTKLLHARNEFPALFQDGDYSALRLDGKDTGHAVGFARTLRRQRLIVVVGRHFAGLSNGGREWPRDCDITIAGEDGTRYRDLLRDRSITDGQPALGELLRELPVCVLIRAE